MEPSRRSFVIERCLGRGGFGEVYQAEMTSAHGVAVQVALKVLRRDVSADSQALKRLKDEGILLAQLNHPAILKVYDLVLLDGRVSLVTELVDGADLETALRGEERIPLRSLLEALSSVASALHAAFHSPITGQSSSLQLVHRDIKPSNIRISRSGDVKLLDFGIARTDELTREAKTQTDMMVGSPPYMAPERFLDNELRSASDVFSLGAILIEGILGRRLFDQPVTVLAAFAVAPTRYEEHLDSMFAEIPADIPPDVVALGRQMLAYDPKARPTAAEVSERCEALADRMGGLSLRRWCKERRWPKPKATTGDLDGRVVTEDTLAREHIIPERSARRAPRAAEPAPKRSVLSRLRGALFWFGGASLSALVAGGILAALLVFALWLSDIGSWRAQAERTPAPPEQPKAPVAIPPPVQPQQPPVEDTPLPEQPKAAPSAPKRPKSPAAQPALELPAPELPAPESPAPESPAPTLPAPELPGPPAERHESSPVRITLGVDAAAAKLVGGGRTYVPPAAVPPGDYHAEITLVSGRTVALSVRATGASVRLDCNLRLVNCSATQVK